MILAALLLQAAPAPPAAPRAPAAPAAPATPAAPAAPPRPSIADTLKPVDSQLAIDTFKTVCWAAFREPEAFHAAVAATTMALTPVPREESATAQQGELYRSDEAVLTYVASDTLPAGVPTRQCTLRVRLAGSVDQLSLAARIAAALGLPSGRTRTNAALSLTQWDVTGEDQRTTRLFAITRAAPHGGGSELRLSALLLAAK